MSRSRRRFRRRIKTIFPDARWFLAVALIAGVAAMLHQSSRLRRGWEIRDAVSETPPLSPAHAGLSGASSSCRHCHLGAAATSNAALWGGGATWDERLPKIPNTAVCVSCHDGALASGAVVHGSHPIGIDYESARRGSPDRFNDLAGHKEVRLDDGRTVGCLSCHTIHRQAMPGARPSINESACETCHNL